jgi:hypothetical protein
MAPLLRLVLWTALVSLLILLAPFVVPLGQAGPNVIPDTKSRPASGRTKSHYIKLNTIIDRPITLTVNMGIGGGDYAIGSLVTVSANPAPEGKRFSGWTGDIVILANPFIYTYDDGTRATNSSIRHRFLSPA